MPGIRTSLTTRSGTLSATRTSASAPPRAVTTSNPSPRRHAPTARRRFGSSSTTSKRFDILPLLGPGRAALVKPRGQAHGEGRPPDFARRRALGRDAPAELRDDAAREVEPEPDAGRFGAFQREVLAPFLARRRRGRAAPEKLLEDEGQVFRKDADARVLHSYLDRAGMTGRARAERDSPALWRVLDRVLDEAAHDAPQRLAVGQDGRRVVRRFDRERQAARAGGVRLDARARPHKLRRVHTRPRHPVRARLDAREVEEIQDEVDLPVALGRDGLKVLAPLLLALPAALQDAREGLDGRQGRAKLVRDA